MTNTYSSLLRTYHISELEGEQLWIALAFSLNLPYLVIRYDSDGYLTHGFIYKNLQYINDPYMFQRSAKHCFADEIQYQENKEKSKQEARLLLDQFSFSHPYVIYLIQNMKNLSVLYNQYGYVATNGSISVVGKTFLESAVKLCIIEHIGEYVQLPPLTSETYQSHDIYPEFLYIRY